LDAAGLWLGSAGVDYAAALESSWDAGENGQIRAGGGFARAVPLATKTIMPPRMGKLANSITDFTPLSCAKYS
jgi:hypothetical protein